MKLTPFACESTNCLSNLLYSCLRKYLAFANLVTCESAVTSSLGSFDFAKNVHIIKNLLQGRQRRIHHTKHHLTIPSHPRAYRQLPVRHEQASLDQTDEHCTISPQLLRDSASHRYHDFFCIFLHARDIRATRAHPHADTDEAALRPPPRQSLLAAAYGAFWLVEEKDVFSAQRRASKAEDT